MFEIGLFSSGYLALIEIGIVYLKRLWIDKIRIIYIVHFCAIFQKFCSGGGSNSYEKAFFAPLICEKILASFCPPLNKFCPPLSICSGGGKKCSGGGKKKSRALRARLCTRNLSILPPPEKNP